jgi:hypothetical protein
MTPPTKLANHGSWELVKSSPLSRMLNCRHAPVLNWESIGAQIALIGGLVPLFLAFGALLTAVGYFLWLGNSQLNGPIVGVLTFSAVGFPFLLFICFMFSTLATLPIVSGLEWIVSRAHFQTSRRMITAIGGGVVSSAWMLVLVVAYLLLH